MAIYLRDGGGIVYFLTTSTDRTNLDMLAKHAEGDLKLPFKPKGLLDSSLGGDTGFAMLSEANYDSPILKKFRDTDDLANLNFKVDIIKRSSR